MYTSSFLGRPLLVSAALVLGCVTPRSDGLPDLMSDGSPAGPPTTGPRSDGPAPGPTTTPMTPATPGAPDDPGCPPGFHNCKGQCVDSMLPENCGVACEPCEPIEGGKATCDGKLCGGSCPAGQKLCANRCIPENDPCADMCPMGKNLCNGVCVMPTSLSACGSSCTPCPTSPNGVSSCDGDRCELACNPGFHECEDRCLDDTKPTSCGDSCAPCPIPTGGTAVCEAGKCGSRCPSGTKLCAGSCIPTNMACNGVCPGGQHDCDGICVDDGNVNFCGPSCTSCGSRENATAKCEDDRCVFTCRAGFHDCNGTCKDNRSLASCGDRCDRCPERANAAAKCDGTSCGFTCNPGTYECNNACIPRNQPCNGSCQGGLKLCGSTCVEGNCCPGDSCGPCKSCVNNRCQATTDGQPGPGCSGTCRECRGGSCGDRPNSKACGNRCVSRDECCEACGDCRSCRGGTCVADDNAGGCDGCLGCSGGGCRPQNSSCSPPANASGICQANGSCDFRCNPPLVRDGNRCVECSGSGRSTCDPFEHCQGGRCTPDTGFDFQVTSAPYGASCENFTDPATGEACGPRVPRDMRSIFNGCGGRAPCTVDFPGFNVSPEDPCPNCKKSFEWSWVCLGRESRTRGQEKGDSTGAIDPGDRFSNGTTRVSITCL